jgi:integrase
MKTKLTSKIVGALELPHGKTDMIVWDSVIGGFGIRVRNRTGVVTKTWIIQKKRQRQCFKITIGGADIITLDAAREKAKTLLAEITLGHDPQAESAKQRHLLKALVPDYLKHQEKRIRPRSYVEVERYLTGDYFKPLHSLSVDQIKRADVSERVEAIEDERGSATARESRVALSGFFSWAMQKGFVEANPVLGSIKAATNGSRDRVLSDAEIAAIWRACGDDDGGKIVRLLALTGCRRSEIGGIAWSWFAPDMSSFTIPASRSKNKRPHTLPVMPMMRQIIETVPHVAGRDQMFGVRHALGFSLWNESKRALDNRLGDSVQPSWHLHDIRRTVATRLGDLGVQPHVIEALLNHQSGSKRGVAGTYNKSPYANEMRNALATWHDRVRSLIDGGERKVVTFPQSA